MDEDTTHPRTAVLRSGAVGVLLFAVACTVGDGGPWLAVVGAAGILWTCVSLITAVEHRRTATRATLPLTRGPADPC